MSTGRTESELVDVATRRSRDAATRVHRSTLTLGVAVERPSARWLLGSQAELLLESILNDAETLSHLVNDDGEIERLEGFAVAVRASLRSRRLALKLSAVEGRTEAEAETFLAAADRLRAAS